MNVVQTNLFECALCCFYLPAILGVWFVKDLRFAAASYDHKSPLQLAAGSLRLATPKKSVGLLLNRCDKEGSQDALGLINTAPLAYAMFWSGTRGYQTLETVVEIDAPLSTPASELTDTHVLDGMFATFGLDIYDVLICQ